MSFLPEPILVPLPDGHRLCVVDIGDPDGPTVMYWHGRSSSLARRRTGQRVQ
jgi:hypothetical protein